MRNRWIVFALLLLICPLAESQSLTREVKGTVRDQNGYPLRGAVVQIENVKTLLVRSFITTRSGEYHFAGVATFEDYELRAHYHGQWSDTRYLSRLNSDSPVIVNLTVEKE